MKRRVISFITVLALCTGLCPWAAAGGWETDDGNTPMAIASVDNDPGPAERASADENTLTELTYEVTTSLKYDMHGYKYTVTGGTAFSVKNNARLYLTTGTIESTNGAGIEVLDGGFLRIEDPGMHVVGTTYGLEVSPGAAAWLFGGTFTGGLAAVRADDYRELLVTGYAYYDDGGNVCLPENVGGLKTVVVRKCTEHKYDYTKDPDAPNHGWICLACGTKDEETPCSFSFDTYGNGVCAECGRKIKIEVDIDEDSLVYDGTPRPDNVSVTVTLDDAATLDEGTDYSVDWTPGINAGETVSVTVSAISYEGDFTETFRVAEDTPKISWDIDRFDFNYEADKAALLSKIETALLSKLSIDIKADGDALKGDIKFFYKRENDPGADFTEGLPTNAGTYEIKAFFPGKTNYIEKWSDRSATLTIRQIDIDYRAPEAAGPVYNGSAQELVTHGSAPDDAEIQFAETENGPWSRDIPTGVNAGEYRVWYRIVDEAKNYNVVAATQIYNVVIQRKEIRPTVELEYYTVVYDGGYKEPKVTVKDGGTVLPDSEYNVAYKDNLNVGTEATVTVTDKAEGNYKILETAATFQITQKDQDGLNITGQPSVVTYGDVFVLGTSGGSGNGTITWEVLKNKGADGEADTPSTVAAVDEMSGQVTIIGVGAATVRATRNGTDYKEATAEWTFDARKKTAVAQVTAQNKTYNGNNIATVDAVVDRSCLAFAEDTISIAVSGTFSDKNVGAGKIVTVDTDNAVVSGTGKWQNYDVKYSSENTAVTADITKAETEIPRDKRPTAKSPSYNGGEQNLIDNDAEAEPVDKYLLNDEEELYVEYSLSKDGAYSTAVPTGTDAGGYEVWYRVKEGENFAGTTAVSITVTISPKTVTPVIELEKYSYVYDGSPKEPAVTVMDGSDKIPAGEYTVKYGNNVDVGVDTATVTVTDKAGGNYTFEEQTAKFSITVDGSAVLTKPRARDLTYNGQPQELVTAGTASGGTMVYALAGNDGEAPADAQYMEEIPKGEDAAAYTVYYKVRSDGNHDDTAPEKVTVTIKPKQVLNPVIALVFKDTDTTYNGIGVEYNGEEYEPTVTVKDGNALIEDSEYTLEYSDNLHAGTATVHIINKDGGNYIINGRITFEIRKKTAAFTTGKEPTGKTGLQYTGKSQALLEEPGASSDGDVAYSLDGINYTLNPPRAIDADDYTVWCKVIGDSDHSDSTPVRVPVTIEKAEAKITAPEAAENLFYTGSPLALVTHEAKDGDIGTLKYSLSETGTYSETIPTAVNAGSYKVWYKVEESGNWKAEGPGTVDVRIAQRTVTNPVITCSPATFPYDGTEKTPNIVVYDGGREIPAGEYTVAVSPQPAIAAGEYTVTVTDRSASDGNYVLSGDTSASFEIVAASQAPLSIVTDRSRYVYYGDTFKLSTVGGSGSGKVTWSSDKPEVAKVDEDTGVVTVKGVNPTGFTITASKAGDNNYAQSNTDSVTFIAEKKPVTPVITVADKYYDDKVDAALTVSWKSGDMVVNDGVRDDVQITLEGKFVSSDAGTGKQVNITVKDVSGNNAEKYNITYPTVTGNIQKAQAKITKPPESAGDIPYNGSWQKLAEFTKDDADIGTVKFSTSKNGVYSGEIPSGKDAGDYEVWYKVEEGLNWTGTDPVCLKARITVVQAQIQNAPRKINNLKYTGQPLKLVTEGTTMNNIGNVVYLLDESGVVEYSTKVPEVTDAGTYTVWYKVDDSNSWTGTTPGHVEVNVDKADAELTSTPADKSLVYIPDTAQPLIDEITTVVDIGTVKYWQGTSSEGEYTTTVPKATNAGKYTVWYKVEMYAENSGNWNDLGPESVTATIYKKNVTAPTVLCEPNSFTYERDVKQEPEITVTDEYDNVISPDEYTVTIRLQSSAGEEPDIPIEAGVYTVTVTANENGNYTFKNLGIGTFSIVSAARSSSHSGTSAAASTNTSVSNGTASTVLTASAANELVNKAVEDKSTNIVIRPEITGGVTKAEVSIPVSAISRIKNETEAALTVSTPIADVTISNAALDTLSGAGGAVSVVTAKVDNTVVLTLTADGNDAGSIPGGLTLTVPAEDAGPGTVAVLVYEDGTRETIRKSVAENGEVRIPLDGSATVEIVDNSKEFTDVPAEGWAADAVAFASSHELFNGTGEATFSPEDPMSRAMLATVLYNLDGSPNQSLADSFSDIGSDSWYASSVSWAAENGIIGGYGDGQFGPDDSVTREQFAVMLWRYAGSPAADGQSLSFTDADQASGYAMQALYWAAANGIISGYGDGRLDPGGQATRAQAAQMLRKFIENL